ncbi:MAG: hypothetical protein A2445_02720 [Candidatus Jacksonbacteria bacterium RIFOXYC2_FULL_44_29]|nr:MAG: Pseudouridine synthase [Parcubacteria group bacterium GW2011_GWA2_42_28]KKT55915.1 MAG: Pseudouridine synthase [Parcubacteria group bacterium GW2011_GWC2_44_22]OGY74527.1 MAG: hypothetical protein A2240_02975 [Candidatus Jacksonbacteria bacterium RIFOXYA2_FULL_43_12]OGY77437.1 MAG: hypothetical protein A2295_01925 [Candidatus Jacksonbacteria bacterium RIFOXYB2_FULL_44_15]OGY78209.1 MAG: hypothetical protein A2550_06270 [Candidatus Jacksonbacteria bacterium RIFOXYD2_FULL_43_21]OGY80787.
MKQVYLQQFIAKNTQFSRRKAVELIKQKVVMVNDSIALIGQKIDPQQDEVKIKAAECSTWNILINDPDALVYYLVNKPAGYVCTLSDRFAVKKVVDLVPRIPKVYPVGRLDADTEGLIILTNDGDFAYKLTHPKFEVEKEYYVEASRNVPPQTTRRARVRDRRGTFVSPIDVQQVKDQLLRGVKLDDGAAKVDQINNINKLSTDTIQLNLVLHSGKKRIIRRIFGALGWKVIKLVRIRIGTVKIDVPTGQFRKLSELEVKKLMK